jgi:NhaP-type Na+/H+ or K+/H+ antiporter
VRRRFCGAPAARDVHAAALRAQSLPQGVPYRAQLILIAFTVAIVTLLLQGGTLPLVIRLVRIQGVDRSRIATNWRPCWRS